MNEASDPTLFDPQPFSADLPATKLPFFPVLEAWGSDVAGLAFAIGVHPRTVKRWLDDGVSFTMADELCVLVGRHPSELWGDLWLESIAEE